ncbi:MAG: hypothetical protein H7Y32_02865 [Chloroflexales bacterium]|nr:hypothetical protein [Chloroflexales bacterium]
MSRSTKLTLDIVLGAVVPVLILSYASRPLGSVAAYILAALVPVAWVFIDLLFITRRFNAITAFTGAGALVSGLLAFWFVDGALFALKDTAGIVLSLLIFAITMLAGRPLIKYFVVQALDPDTPERAAALDALIAERRVQRAFMAGTLVVVAVYAVLAVVNFYLNLNTVVAPFGSEEFNQQVARVNAITRIAFPLPSIIAISASIWLAYRALYMLLPSEEGKSQFESNFWRLVELRDAGPNT